MFHANLLPLFISISLNPIYFLIAIAAIPDRPTELQAPRNSIRETSLLVTWKPGYNGGRRQTFRLAYCLVDSVLSCPELSNLRNSSFKFAEDTLKPFTLYTIRVWSENEVGRSEEIYITNSTKRKKKRIHIFKGITSRNPLEMYAFNHSLKQFFAPKKHSVQTFRIWHIRLCHLYVPEDI